MRKTSDDYQKELVSARKTLESLEAHIKSRLNQISERFPDAIIMIHKEVPVKARSLSKEWVDKLTPDDMLKHITAIEDHNAKENPVRQTSIYD